MQATFAPTFPTMRHGMAPVTCGQANRRDMGAPRTIRAHPRASGLLVRCSDVLASVFALAVLALPMAAVALAVKLDSRGPAIFRQVRVGLGGKPFTILKFRTMSMDAEAAGEEWASVGDNRVTRVGRFLRLTRIDEIPQFVNVLAGDMSLIGPRPERPFFAALLEAEIPGFGMRTTIKPGLTGWAQVKLGYGASVQDSRIKLDYDLYYLSNRTPLLDLKILVSTVGVIMGARGR